MKKKFLAVAGAILLSLVGCNGPVDPSSSSEEGSISINTSSDDISSSDYESSTGNSEENSSKEEEETEVMPADVVYFHFKEGDVDFDTYGLWIWGTDRAGKVYEVTESDDFGPYYKCHPKVDVGEDFTKEGISLLVRTLGSWSYQTSDTYISYEKYRPKLNENGEYELHVYFLMSINGQDLMVFETLEQTMRDKLLEAYLDKSLKKIKIQADGNISKIYLYRLPTQYFADELNKLYPKITPYLIYDNLETGDSKFAEINLDHDFELNSCYRVGAEFVSDGSYVSYMNVTLDRVFDTTAFDKLNYDGDDLGASFTRDEAGKVTATHFKVWAPTSYYVRVNIYNYGFSSSQLPEAGPLDKLLYDNIAKTKRMTIDEKGVYSCTIDEDLIGKYYTYTIVNSIGTSETIDPYAYSSGINSKRGLIVDFEYEDAEKMSTPEFEALPVNWDGKEGLDIDSSLDLTITETHIRDVTMDDTWSSNPEDDALRGTFKGFIKRGTTYTQDGVTVKTGFDHLEELGVNAVQLIPVFDQDNVEQHEHTTFNWGYNPQLYNVVEGAYSSDPFDGYSRIKDFRELVAAFANNANHARIIMDVVYNHVSSPSTNALNYTCPKYYFRLNSDGTYREGSGCGNEIRTEAPMMRKFIVNSLTFWAEEYKVKGFRFDLMGLIDIDTLKLAKEKLYEIDPDIVLYGEGWTGDGSWNPDSNAVTDSAYGALYESDDSKGMVGAFNDAGRDAIRGGNGSWGETYTKPTHGFIAQGPEHFDAGRAQKIQDMIKGIHTGKGANPEQTINYASCHDNYTLFDQLNWTLSDDGGETEPNIETVARASVAVNATVILSNGVAFINGGEEIFRSKILTDADPDSPNDETTMYGKRISHNSYTYSDECNSYKYDRKVQLLEYFNMYKELIALRKELVTVKYPNNQFDDNGYVSAWDALDNDTVIAFYRQGKDGTDYHMFFNGRSDDATADSAKHTTFVFNNSSKTPTYNNGYVMNEKYQFVVIK